MASWTFEQLKTFAEVVATGSFTRAAESLNLSQPAVSVQIRSLEQSLKVKLLERRPRRLVLTEAGKVVHQYALRLLRTESEVDAELADLEGLKAGSLRLGAGATPSIFTLASTFAEFYRRWPGIELQVRIARTSELVQQVMGDDLDLAIIASDTGQEGLARMPIYSESCVAIAGRTHPLFEHRDLDVRQLGEHPLVMLPAQSGFRRFLQRELAGLEVELTAAMELASLEAIKEVVRTGVLASIVPETAVRDEGPESGLRVLAITGATLERNTVAIQRADKYVSEAMRAFYSLIHERWPQRARPDGQPEGEA